MVDYTAALIALEHIKADVEKLDDNSLVVLREDYILTAKEVVPHLDTAIDAVKNKIAVPVLVRRREGYIRPDYFCPVCHKQQKDTFKNYREGCFCERCGQRLTF